MTLTNNEYTEVSLVGDTSQCLTASDAAESNILLAVSPTSPVGLL